MCDPVTLAAYLVGGAVIGTAANGDSTTTTNDTRGETDPEPLPDPKPAKAEPIDLEKVVTQLDRGQQQDLAALLQSQQNGDELLQQVPNVDPEFTATTTDPSGGAGGTQTVEVPEWETIDADIDALDPEPPREDPPPATHRTTTDTDTQSEPESDTATIPREDPPPEAHRTSNHQSPSQDDQSEQDSPIPREDPPPEAHR